VTGAGGRHVDRRRRLAVALPTMLLLAIAATQMVLARRTDLSPWKGGGFGMFASVDGLPFRWVRLYVSAPERSEEIEVPPSLEDAARRVATWPHRRAVQRLARDVIARERRLARAVDAVRVEVWKAEISRDLDVSEMRIREVTVSADEQPRASRR
jgi:hypothetical protein